MGMYYLKNVITDAAMQRYLLKLYSTSAEGL